MQKFLIQQENTSSSNTDLNTKHFKPTMSSTNDIGMDIPAGQFSNNKSKVRGRNSFLPVNLSRESSVALSGCSTPYHERMNVNMDLSSKESHSELSYEAEQEKVIWISMMANQQETIRLMNVHSEALPSHAQHEKESINIQLPYDPHIPTEPELWSGSFHPISLHGSIKHFALDLKNIKVTLNFLAKHIRNKQVNNEKVNNLGDFDGMGDAIWNFYLLFIRPNRMLYTLIINLTPLGQKFR